MPGLSQHPFVVASLLLISAPCLTHATPQLLAQHPDGRPAREPAGGSWATGFAAPPAGNGLGSTVHAMTMFQGALVLGGDFVDAGPLRAYRIAAWNGDAWAKMGSHGVPMRVFALAEYESQLYAAGTTVQGINMMVWSGSVWQTVPDSPEGTISALKVYNGDLYAAGSFGVQAWDGSAWTIAGGEFTGSVICLETHGTELFAGGDFSVAGGQTALHVARWNGSAWRSLQTGADGSVWTLLSTEDDLFVGGQFRTVSNGTPLAAGHVARWDGSAWNVDGLGTGADGPILSLASFDGGMVAGGTFSLVDTVAAANIASWTAGTWSPLEAGIGGSTHTPRVLSLETFGTSLFVGGQFEAAGGAPSSFVGRWDPVVADAVDAPLSSIARPRPSINLLGHPVRGGVVRFAVDAPHGAPIDCEIYDIRGRSRWAAQVVNGAVEIPTSGRTTLLPGVYYLVARSGGQQTSKAVTVVR